MASFSSSLANSSGDAKDPGPKLSKSKLFSVRSSANIDLAKSLFIFLEFCVTMADTRGGKIGMPDWKSHCRRPGKSKKDIYISKNINILSAEGRFLKLHFPKPVGRHFSLLNHSSTFEKYWAIHKKKNLVKIKRNQGQWRPVTWAVFSAIFLINWPLDLFSKLPTHSCLI